LSALQRRLWLTTNYVSATMSSLEPDCCAVHVDPGEKAIDFLGEWSRRILEDLAAMAMFRPVGVEQGPSQRNALHA